MPIVSVYPRYGGREVSIKENFDGGDLFAKLVQSNNSRLLTVSFSDPLVQGVRAQREPSFTPRKKPVGLTGSLMTMLGLRESNLGYCYAEKHLLSDKSDTCKLAHAGVYCETIVSEGSGPEKGKEFSYRWARSELLGLWEKNHTEWLYQALNERDWYLSEFPEAMLKGHPLYSYYSTANCLAKAT